MLNNVAKTLQTLTPKGVHKEKIMEIIDVENEKFLKAEEVAKILNCSDGHVYNLIKNHLLPVVTLGGSKRIPLSLLNQTIQNNLTLVKTK
jgi:excisionase family DNA binding protein